MKSSVTPAVATLWLGVTMLAGCAAESSSDTIEAGPVPSTSEQASSGERVTDEVDATTVLPVPDEPWAEIVATIVDELAAARERHAIAYIENFDGYGPTEVEHYSTLLAADAAAFEQALDELASVSPTDPELAAGYETFIGAIERAGTTAAESAATIDRDLARYQAEVEGGDIDGTEYVGFKQSMAAALDEVKLACFGLSERIVAAGLGLLDCTDGDDSEEGEDAAATVVDPTTTPTDFEPVELSAGAYEMTVFARPFWIETPETLFVVTSENWIEATGSSAFYQVNFLAYDDVVDPGTVADLPDVASSPGRVDADLIAAMPLTVLDQGTAEIGGLPASWWDVIVDMDRVGELGIDPIVPLVPPGDFPFTGALQGPQPVRLWDVDHPDGGFLVLVREEDTTLADAVSAAEAVLAGITFEDAG